MNKFAIITAILQTLFANIGLADDVGVLPFQTWKLSVDNFGRERMIRYMIGFADRNGYISVSRSTRPNSEFMIIQLNNKGRRILVLNPFEENNFRISYYLENDDVNADLISREIRELDDGLKTLTGVNVIDDGK